MRGLFRRRSGGAAPAAPAGVAATAGVVGVSAPVAPAGQRSRPGLMGSGLLVALPGTPSDAIAAVEAAMETFRPRQYPELPRLVPAGWRWVGADADRPAEVWVGADRDNTPVLVTVRPAERHTEVGFYPWGSADERLHSAGLNALLAKVPGAADAPSRVAPGGTIVLGPPPIPGDLLEGMLRAAGRAVTPSNVDVIGQMFVTQVKVKASQFIQNSASQASALAFLDRWALLRGGHLDVARGVLAELCAWDATVIPYTQDIPLRMRAIMLQVIDTPGTFWDDVT